MVKRACWDISGKNAAPFWQIKSRLSGWHSLNPFLDGDKLYQQQDIVACIATLTLGRVNVREVISFSLILISNVAILI